MRASGIQPSSDLDPLHYLTHFPTDSRCEICSQCKLQNSPRRKNNKLAFTEEGDDSRIESDKFGDIITVDHIILGSDSDVSRHGDTAALG